MVTAAASRFVSLGSILAVLSFPLFVLLFHGPMPVFFWGLAISALVVFKHEGNIRRILAGAERKLGEKNG